MTASNFLVMVNNKLWGYDTPTLLRVDIALNRKQGQGIQGIWERLEGGVVLEYKPISEDELKTR